MAHQKNQPSDPNDSMRAALFQVDADWFATYWYGERTESRMMLLARAIRRFGDALATTLARPMPRHRHAARVNPSRSTDVWMSKRV
jgi:hypothetical protein